MPFYGGERLRLNQHNLDSILIQDARRTISHDEFVQTDFYKLLEAMLTHAPAPRSIAGNIVELRKRVEEEYYAHVQTRDEKALALECYKYLMDRLNDLKEHLYAAVILPSLSSNR